MRLKEESEKAGLKLIIQKKKITASGPITSWQTDGENNGNSDRLYFPGLQNYCSQWLQPWNEKLLAPWKKSSDKPRASVLKKQRHHFANKGPYSQSYVFFSSHVWIWELDHKEGWALKDWCFGTMVLEFLQSPLDREEIKPVNPKGNQPWTFIERIDAEALILRWPDTKSQLNGKDWCWERLRARGERRNRGWHSWTASLTQWTWDWANAGGQWRTGKPAALQSM